jgi:DNA-directed RNA polymerase specialized sigma24 family protein
MIWFSAVGHARLNRLRRPGENMSDVVERALEALEGLGQPRDLVSTDVSSNVTTDTRRATRPEPTPDDARLLQLYRDGVPYEAIAAALGLPLNTVKSRTRALRKKLPDLPPRPRGGARPRRTLPLESIQERI